MNMTEDQIKLMLKNNKPEEASYRLGDDRDRFKSPSEYITLVYPEFKVMSSKINFSSPISGSIAMGTRTSFRLFDKGTLVPLVEQSITEEVFTLLYRETENLSKILAENETEKLNRYINGEKK